MEAMLSIKNCPCCNTVKPTEGFSPDRRNKDGLNYRCKACHAAHTRARYSLDPTPFKAAITKYREGLRDHSA